MQIIPVALMVPVLVFYGLSMAKAQEVPRVGLLYNQQEDASLTGNCKQVAVDQVECDFVQVSVRKKAKAVDLEKKMAEADANFATVQADAASWCQSIVTMWKAVEGKSSPEDAIKQLPNSNPDELRETLTTLRADKANHPSEPMAMEALNRFCATKAKSDYLDFVKRDFERDAQTCLVSSNPFYSNVRLGSGLRGGSGSVGGCQRTTWPLRRCKPFSA